MAQQAPKKTKANYETDKNAKQAVNENRAQFHCGCSGGKTEIISESKVRHTCGFKPSQNYGENGATFTYSRVQINPAHTGGAILFNWFRDYISRPILKTLPVA